jgi:hypothetical protein
MTGRHGAEKAGNLQPLSMPDGRYQTPESPRTRWQGTSPLALSPGSAGSFRSPLFESQIQRGLTSPSHGGHFHDDHNSAHIVNRNSVEQSVFSDPELGMEENGMRDLNLSDKSPSSFGGDDVGHGTRSLKRRAPSPPMDGSRDDRVYADGPYNDLYHRRSMQTMESKYSSGPRTWESGSSYAPMGSHMAASLASSATSYRSEKMSPGPISPHVDPEFVQYSPYLRRRSGDVEPARPDEVQESSRGGYACECCMKKPKRFRTLAELRYDSGSVNFASAYANNHVERMKERSYINVTSVRVASRIKTKLSATKIPFIFDAFHGHVRPSAMYETPSNRQHYMTAQWTTVVIAEHSFLINLSRIGIFAQSI